MNRQETVGSSENPAGHRINITAEKKNSKFQFPQQLLSIIICLLRSFSLLHGQLYVHVVRAVAKIQNARSYQHHVVGSCFSVTDSLRVIADDNCSSVDSYS